MRCRRCGQEMKVKSVEVGKDAQGNPIYNDYAFCYECKIKINLDKKKVKSVKPAEDKAIPKEEEKPSEEKSLLDGMEIPEGLKQAQEPAKEDLSLTRQFEVQVEQLVGKDVEEEPTSNPVYVEEEIKIQEKKAPKKKPEQKKPEQRKAEKRPEKKPESRGKEQMEKRPVKAEKRPERPVRESQKQQEKKFKEMPEKRVKEVRTKAKKKKGKGVIKFLVFVLIMAALGAAIYFNRETVKGWIDVGLEKFDAMTDKKDEKKKEKEEDKDATTDIEDIVDQIDAASDAQDGTDGTDNTNATDSTNATDPAAGTDGENADGTDAQAGTE